MRGRHTVSFDFDGVLHEAQHFVGTAWHAIDVEPIRLAQRAGWSVVVTTANIAENVAAALAERGVSVVTDPQLRIDAWEDQGPHVLVTNRKIAAALYVDDRALRWNYGEWLLPIRQALAEASQEVAA